MFKLNSIARILPCLSLALVLMTGSLKAQDLQTQMSNASTAYKAREYEKCHAILQRIVTNFGGRAPMLYGPKFGTIYYRKGLVELKLSNNAKLVNDLGGAKKYLEEAVKSFQTCYEKFPNGAKDMAETINSAHKASLQRWAEANMGLKKYEDAIKLYKKFMLERDKKKDDRKSPILLKALGTSKQHCKTGSK